MSELKFNKGTDEEHEIKLDSHLISATWTSAGAYIGQKARFEVRTALVGNGAKIKIKGKSEGGEKLGTIKGEITNNVFVGEFDLPENMEKGDQVYFEVKLSKNNLEGESERIPVLPCPALKSIGWSEEEARRGDILTLSAELENVDDYSEVMLVIYEYDEDKAHDRICELPAIVQKGKVDVKWEYEYHEDTDEIPTQEEREQYGGSYNPPEYFFTIKLDDLELGKQQESGILKFKDWIEIRLVDGEDSPVADARYIVHLPDGTEKEGNLDGDGAARVDGVPPGRYTVEFPDVDSPQ